MAPVRPKQVQTDPDSCWVLCC